MYGTLIGKSARQEGLTVHDLFLLFLCAVDFHVRGVKFNARSDEEEFDLYLKRIHLFKRRLLGPDMEQMPEAKVRQWVLANWNFAIVQFPEEAAILTSDSPSLWFSSSRSAEHLRSVLLPITPLRCFVGVHRDYYHITSFTANPDDAAIVVNNEIENCAEAVFCSEPLSSQQSAVVQTRLKKRSVIQPRAGGWVIELIDYDLNPNLSFLVPVDTSS